MSIESLVPDDMYEILQSDDIMALQTAHRLIDQRIERAERNPSIDATNLRSAKRVRLLFRDRLVTLNAGTIKRKRLMST